MTEGIMKYTSTGKLTYKSDTWASLMIDRGLLDYYRSTIFANKDRILLPMHGPHITVVNGHWEVVPNREHWGKYEGEKIEFRYDGEVRFVRGVWFMYCEAPRIEEIRAELGLTREFARRPLHFTIGRLEQTKEQRENRKRRQAEARERRLLELRKR